MITSRVEEKLCIHNHIKALKTHEKRSNSILKSGISILYIFLGRQYRFGPVHFDKTSLFSEVTPHKIKKSIADLGLSRGTDGKVE